MFIIENVRFLAKLMDYPRALPRWICIGIYFGMVYALCVFCKGRADIDRHGTEMRNGR